MHETYNRFTAVHNSFSFSQILFGLGGSLDELPGKDFLAHGSS